MATDTNEQVTTGSVNEEVDFNEIATSLGLRSKPADEKEETDEKTEQQASETEEETKAETTEEESDGDTKSEPDDKDGEEEEAGEEKSEPEPSKVQQRIDKLVAQRMAAVEERDTLRAELEAAKAQAAAKPPVVTVDPENPLSSFTDASALEAELQRAQAVLDWADDNREGGSVNVNGKEEYYDADAIKTIRSNAKSILRAAPQQQKYLQEREVTVAEAKSMYPDFFQKGTTAHSFMQATLKQYPFLTRIPGWELVIGDAFEGQRLRAARIEQLNKRSAAGKSSESSDKAEAAGTTRVPKTPAPSSSPKVSSSKAALRSKTEAFFKAPGRRESLEALMEEIV